jgi:hypothetical protein
MNQQYVIIDLKNGDQCEGSLVNIDKVNFKIILSDVKKSTTIEGIAKQENFANLEINKEDIKEVKIVQYEQKESTVKQPINSIPANKVNPIQQNANKAKTYDKNESFFDNLIPMNKRESNTETIRYNDKNAETFYLPADSELLGNNNYNRGGSRGRGRARGKGYRGNRGGNNYQGGYNNNYKGNNNRGGYKSNNYYQNYNKYNINDKDDFYDNKQYNLYSKEETSIYNESLYKNNNRFDK